MKSKKSIFFYLYGARRQEFVLERQKRKNDTKAKIEILNLFLSKQFLKL